MKRYRIIYMGTPFFAKEVLQELLTFNQLEIVGVVTQPDKPVGRKQTLQSSEVKKCAQEYNLSLFQPEKIGQIVSELKALNADAIITCAYGQFLPSKILNLTQTGVINIHASLLPKYRGGAPMQHAIMNNEKITGITLMKSVLEMDAGDMYDKQSVSIDFNDTLETLEKKLIEASKVLLNKSLIKILDHKIEPIKQDESLVSIAKTIQKEDEKLNFSKDGLTVYNKIRALYPNPMAYGYLDNKRIKFGKCNFEYAMHIEKPGTILQLENENMTIALKDGLLFVKECQIEGKQLVDVKTLINGYKNRWEGKVINDENN